jgi:uroporphyrinogen-III synthase
MAIRSKRVVLTRSREGNAELSSRLAGLGFSPIEIDTLVFSPPSDWSQVDALIGRLASFDWLLLTSATGVRFFAQRARRLNLRMPWSGKPNIAAVGPKTASALAALGLKTDFVPSSYRISALADELPSTGGLRVLLLRADIADGGLFDRLQERGFDVEASSIYSTSTSKGDRPQNLHDADFVVFASPSAVRGLCSRLRPEELSELRKAKALCIGPVTESAAKEHGFSDTFLPPVYTLDAVLAELARLSRDTA